MKKYRISDLILDCLKCTLLHLGFYIVGYIAFAMTAGHMMMNEYADESAKHNSLMFYSAAITVIYIAVICVSTRRNVGRKTRLIEASRDDAFDLNAYFMEDVKRTSLPLFVGGILALLPYTIFFTAYGWDYLYPSLLDRLYSASMISLDVFGGIIGSIVYNLIIVLAYTVFLFKTQKKEIEDRLWIKQAPKQEIVKLNKPRDHSKDY